MSDMTPQERRQHQRFSLNLQARITYRHAGQEAPVVDTVAADISAGGAFVRTSHPFPLAAKIGIDFHISQDDLHRLKFILSRESLQQLAGGNIWVQATGIVIRREPEGVAIIFDADYQLTPLKRGMSTYENFPQSS
jgi:c-di-GMP-binding flagellar brake protein YcgR